MDPAETIRPLRPDSGFFLTLWGRDRDPYQEHVRWRLHLRLLLVTAVLTAGLAFLRLVRAGVIDAISLGVIPSVVIWFYLSRSPSGNRLAVRINLALFFCIGIWDTFFNGHQDFPWCLVAIMIIPVFGTLLDGMTTGGLTLLVCLGMDAACIASGRSGGRPLVIISCGMSACILYGASLAHTWIFGSLVDRLRASRQAIAVTTRTAQDLAEMLAREVVKTNESLRARLTQGFAIREDTEKLQAMLTGARARLPAAVPQGPVDPEALLDQLRRESHRVYLAVGMAMSLISGVIALGLGMPRWQTAFMVSAAAGAAIWADSRGSRTWRWRLRGFALLCMAVMATDIWFSRLSPPANSIIFLPSLVFYIGMLDSIAAAAWLSAACLALLLWAQWGMAVVPGQTTVHIILAMWVPGLLAVSALVNPIYQGLLVMLAKEEEGLRLSLQNYRKAVSSLFHDLANPLSVLQALATLPKNLLRPEDEGRALRMVERLENIAANHAAPAPSRFAELADSLRDLFKERLSGKGLGWEVAEGSELMLAPYGPHFRESILGNLISNAIKYSPDDGTLSLAARTEAGFVVVSLSDQGPGYPKTVLGDLAQGIAPVSQPGTGGETGSGFGLLLANAYAHELGGRLELKNLSPNGALAEVWLPSS